MTEPVLVLRLLQLADQPLLSVLELIRSARNTGGFAHASSGTISKSFLARI